MIASLKVELAEDKPADGGEQEIVEQLIRDCAGDPRRAILGLVRISSQLVRKNEQLVSAVSVGFVRQELQRLRDLCP